jgi:hypothetical protein
VTLSGLPWRACGIVQAEWSKDRWWSDHLTIAPSLAWINPQEGALVWTRGLVPMLTACFASLFISLISAQRPADRSQQIPIDIDDIAGTVMSDRGPEAGVWVIAVTDDTPTKFHKIVVTDDQGRFLLPDRG